MVKKLLVLSLFLGLSLTLTNVAHCLKQENQNEELPPVKAHEPQPPPSSPDNDKTPKTEDKPKVDYCFIATAARGSCMAEEAVVLRNFRDNIFLKNSLGRIFVKSYYKVAPPLANYIGKHEISRTATRLALTPLVCGVGYQKISVLIFLFSIIAITLTLRIRRSNRF